MFCGSFTVTYTIIIKQQKRNLKKIDIKKIFPNKDLSWLSTVIDSRAYKREQKTINPSIQIHEKVWCIKNR